MFMNTHNLSKIKIYFSKHVISVNDDPIEY